LVRLNRLVWLAAPITILYLNPLPSNIIFTMHSSPQFLVRSKPILPLPLHVPKQSSFQPKDVQFFASQRYHPDPQFSSVPLDMTSCTQDQMRYFLQNWPESINSHHQYDYGPLSAAPPAPPVSSAHQPGLSFQEHTSLHDYGRTMFDGAPKQSIRKRTAQACEKCRNRKTKVCILVASFCPPVAHLIRIVVLR